MFYFTSLWSSIWAMSSWGFQIPRFDGPSTPWGFEYLGEGFSCWLWAFDLTKANTATFKGMVVRDGDAICLMVAWWQLEMWDHSGIRSCSPPSSSARIPAGVGNFSLNWNELDQMHHGADLKYPGKWQIRIGMDRKFLQGFPVLGLHVTSLGH